MHGWVASSSRDSHGEDAAAGNRAVCPGRGVAPSGRDPALALLLVSTLAVGLGVGCAARRPVSTPVPSPPVPGQAATPTAPGTAPSESSRDAFPPLPGTNRVYPSQDPRNHATPDAPEAFPLPGAVAGSVVKGAVAESAAEDAMAESLDENPAAESVDEDAMAESLDENPAAESVDEDAMAESLDEDPAAESVDEDPTPGASVVVSPPPSAAWSVQLLASSSLSVARERAGALTPYFPEPLRVEPVAGLFKVRVGRCANRGEAEALRRKALDLGLRDAFVVPAEAGGEAPR